MMTEQTLSARRRIGWGIADQALSSATNFGLAIVVARAVDPSGFGAFGLVFTAYALALGTSRAVVSEPLAIRFTASAPDRQRRASARAVGVATVLGLAGGLLVTFVGLGVTGDLRGTLLALGLCLPGLLAQDAWRTVFLTLGQPRRAFSNDVAWAMAQVAGLAVVLPRDPSPGGLVAVWGFASVLAALFGCAQARSWPVMRSATVWLSDHRDLWPRLTAEFWVMTGVWQIALVVVAAVAGLQAVGAIRGAQTLLGPLNLLFLAIPLVMLPEAARIRARRPDRLLGLCFAVSVCLAVLATLAGIAGLLIPDDVGRAVLGSSWAGTRQVLLPIALLLASTGVNLGALLGLRALGATKASLRARLRVAPLVVVGGIAGALVAGGQGAAMGLALANWVAAVVWWRALRRLTGTEAG